MHLERILGGSPLAVLARLVFISLVIGAIMTGIGLTPQNLLDRLVAAGRAVFGMGLGAFRDVAQYILTGAVVVIPVWLVLRLTGWAR